MSRSGGAGSVSSAGAGAEENDSARLQQLERKLADMAALFDRQQEMFARQHEMLTWLAEDGRGEESGIDGASSRRREPAGTADLRTTSYRLGEAMYTRGLQPTEPVTELDRSATSSAGGCPSSRDANEGVPVEDVPRRDDQWGEGGTVRGLGPARESADISGYRGVDDFMGGGFKQSVPTFDGRLFPRYQQEAILFARHYGFESVFTETAAQRDVNVEDTDVSTARLEAGLAEKL